MKIGYTSYLSYFVLCLLFLINNASKSTTHTQHDNNVRHLTSAQEMTKLRGRGGIVELLKLDCRLLKPNFRPGNSNEPSKFHFHAIQFLKQSVGV